MRSRKGLMLLDVLIIILVVGVVATILMPYLRTEEEIRIRNTCREKLLLISRCELKYYETAGGKLKVEPAVTDSSDTTTEKTAEPDSGIVKVFTKDFEELKQFFSEDTKDFTNICPLDGREYIIIARDSFFFSISCPNGHGQIILGTPTWE